MEHELYAQRSKWKRALPMPLFVFVLDARLARTGTYSDPNVKLYITGMMVSR